MSDRELIGLVEGCLVEGWWGIFTFHGVDEGHLPISEHDLCGLLDHLVRSRDRVWTAPLIDVARHIVDHTPPVGA